MCSGQLAAAAQACRSAHSPIGTISPVSSASGMNSRRRDEAALGMVPAQQRLQAADLVALEVDERLVVELELAVGQRLAQIELQLAARLHVRRPCPARRSGRCRAPRPWPGARARSAFLRSWSALGAVARRDGDADAGADRDLVAVEVERRADRLDDAGRERRGGNRLLGSRSARWRTRRRPAARPCRRPRRRRAGAAPTAFSRASPTGWPSVSLMSLKRSRSRQSTATAPALSHAVERLLQALAQQHAVGQLGQDVVVRHVGHARLDAPLLGDVLVRGRASRRPPSADA